MKKCAAVLILLFGVAFSLFAQYAENVTIFVPQVIGTGASPDDNEAFTNILIQEMKSRNLDVKETREEADYALIGTLAPSSDPNSAGYSLSLALQDKDDFILYEQILFYNSVEEASTYLSLVLLNMLSNIFVLHVVVPVEKVVYVDNPVEEDEEEDEEAWRNKQWYISLNGFWNPRIYYGTKTEFFGFNFGWGISAEFNLQKYGYDEMVYLKYLAVGTGVEFVSDWVVASPKSNDDYRNTILQLPLTIYGVFKPGSIFLLQPYLGLFFNIPLLQETTPPVLSWDTGFQFGIKAGKGVVYADTRFSMDFGKSGLSASRPNDTRQYDRFMLYMGIGYKYDLVEPAVGLIKNIFQNIMTMIQKSKSAPEPEEPQVPVEEAEDEDASE